jgi:hypothetical protein
MIRQVVCGARGIDAGRQAGVCRERGGASSVQERIVFRRTIVLPALSQIARPLFRGRAIIGLGIGVILILSPLRNSSQPTPKYQPTVGRRKPTVGDIYTELYLGK